MSGVLYEVNLCVRPDLADAWQPWLEAHVARMLALPGFIDARIGRDRDTGADGWQRWCCHYRLRDAAALDDYLRDQAPRMRAEGLARFGDGFRASRRILDLVAST